jgi:hypothetical protein
MTRSPSIRSIRSHREKSRRSRRITPADGLIVAGSAFCLIQLMIVVVTATLHLAHML